MSKKTYVKPIILKSVNDLEGVFAATGYFAAKLGQGSSIIGSSNTQLAPTTSSTVTTTTTAGRVGGSSETTSSGRVGWK